MPKVTYNKTKGLFQESGQGQVHTLTANSTDDTLAIKSSSDGAKLEYRVITEQITLADGGTTSQGAAGFVPAGMIVLGGQLKVVTPGADANAAPSSLGDGSDADHFGAFTLNTQSASAGDTVLLTPTDLAPSSSAIQLTVTHSSVTQNTEAVVEVTLFGMIPVKA